MKTPKYKIAKKIRFTLNGLRIWKPMVLMLMLVLSAMNCRPVTEDKMTPLMPGAANLVIIYKKGATNEQIENFQNNVLAHPRPDGRGSELLPAIGVQIKLGEKSGYDSTAIGYHSYATPEERKEVKRAALSSQIVYKVLEDVDPSQIKRIE